MKKINLKNMPEDLLRKIEGVEGFGHTCNNVRELSKHASEEEIIIAAAKDGREAESIFGEAEHFASNLRGKAEGMAEEKSIEL